MELLGEYFPVQFGTEQSVDASARLDQLIFDGSYLVGLQASTVFLKISRQNKVKSELEVKRLVTDAYVNVLLAEERKRILEKNLEKPRRNPNRYSQSISAGLG